MNIFQIITLSEYGGAQSVAAALLGGMQSEGENRLFVLSTGEGEAWTHLDNRIKRIRLGKQRKQVSFWDILVFFRLLYYRFRYCPDVVHLHSSKMGVLGRLAFPRKKIVYTVHGFDSIRKAFPKYLYIEKILKNSSAFIVPVSEYDKRCLAEEGISKNVVMIYNGIEDNRQTDRLPDRKSKQIENEMKKLREKYGKVVCCIARISPQKKFDLFVETALLMPGVAFVWIGNKERIDNLPANVFCLGECRRASDCLALSDVFMLPSNYEGMPVSILEAMRSGVPVVATDVGGVSEMIGNGCGFALENKPDLFASKISLLLQSPSLMETMGETARKTFLAKFSIEKMISGYEALYKQIAYGRTKK